MSLVIRNLGLFFHRFLLFRTKNNVFRKQKNPLFSFFRNNVSLSIRFLLFHVILKMHWFFENDYSRRILDKHLKEKDVPIPESNPVFRI